MALGAGNAILGMRRVANICPGQALGMAAEAGIENLLRRQCREGNDGCFASMRSNVQFAWAVAAFAPGIGRFFLSGGNALEMRVFVEPEPHVGVAGFADHASDEAVLCVSGANGRAEKHQAQEKS